MSDAITRSLYPIAKATGVFVAVFLSIGAARAGEPSTGPTVEVLQKQLVYRDGHNNAWTDLALFQGRWYVSFRSGWLHRSPGRMVYVRSTDLSATQWEQPRGFAPLDWDRRAALDLSLAKDDRGGLADGNTKLFVWQDKLWAVVILWEHAGGSAGAKPFARPYISHSPDGVLWADFQPIMGEDTLGTYVWRVEEYGGQLYATTFQLTYPRTKRHARLLRSKNALDWEQVSQWHGTQVGLLIDESGEIVVTANHKAGNSKLSNDALRRSKPPYDQWQIEELGFGSHAPILRRVQGRLVMAGTEYLKSPGRQTTIRVHDGKRFGPPTILYDHGDSGYPGMMNVPGKDDEVLVSYYGGKDKVGGTFRKKINGVKYWGWKETFLQPCDIYVARVRVVP